MNLKDTLHPFFPQSVKEANMKIKHNGALKANFCQFVSKMYVYVYQERCVYLSNISKTTH